MQFWYNSIFNSIQIPTREGWPLFKLSKSCHCQKAESAHFQVPKNGTNPKADHFFTPTSPQNGGLDICFMCLELILNNWTSFLECKKGQNGDQARKMPDFFAILHAINVMLNFHNTFQQLKSEKSEPSGWLYLLGLLSLA